MRTIVFTLITLMISMAYAKDLPRVAIIDTGFSGMYATPRTAARLCKTGHRDFTMNSNSIGYDAIGHGTFVANLIAENSRKAEYCIVVLKVHAYIAENTRLSITRALVHAYRINAIAVNISMGEPNYSQTEKRVMTALTKRGTKVFVSAGNEATKLNQKCKIYPACYNIKNGNMYVVGSVDKSQLLETYSNRGIKVHIFEYGTIPGVGRGTSFASPRALARYLREKR